MSERKIIFKARVGSKLHGTSTPKSDEDFIGVFLPSTEDLLGMQGRPKEWTENEKLSEGARNTVGDTDCKYLALYEFFKQAAQGQSQAIELFFIPEEHVIIETEEWKRVKEAKDLFLSRKSIIPIIGFALAQVHKAKIKGENLNKINALINQCDAAIERSEGRSSILENLQWKEQSIGDREVSLFGINVQMYTNEHGFTLVTIAGRDYDLGTTIKRFREGLQSLEEKYGSRVRLAAQMTHDFKSATHAFRLLGEAEEFIQTGYITFPRPEADFLLEVKEGLYEGDLEQDIQSRLDTLRQELEPKSPLKLEPNHAKINELCIAMLETHIFDNT